MKKIITAALCIILVLSLSAKAFAAGDGAAEADALHTLGLIKGVGDTEFDPALGKTLTRAEAITVICRFMGAEEDALGLSRENPFTDVPEWAVPYTGWAFAAGITKGTDGSTFSPNMEIPWCQFVTLMLRALGYTEEADGFTWNEPFNMAKSVGLLTSIEGTESTLYRSSMALVCWNALSAPVKGGNMPLKDKLIAMGVFTGEQFEAARQTLQPPVTGEPAAEYFKFDASIYTPGTEDGALLETGETLTHLRAASSISSCLLVSFNYNDLRDKFGSAVADAVKNMYLNSEGAWGNSVTGDEKLWKAITEDGTIGMLGTGVSRLFFSDPATLNLYTLTITITAE